MRGDHDGMSGGDYEVLVKLREKRRRGHIWFLENEEDGWASVDEGPIQILRSRCQILFCYSKLWKT